MVRPDSMSDHAGQVSLPGGMLEAGETTADCALREWEEELGVSQKDVEIVGALKPLWVFVSNFLVTPHVAILKYRPEFQPSPTEVAEIIELPLNLLLNPAAHESCEIVRRSLRFSAPCYSYGGHNIWGATSIILAEFAARLTDLA